jgi:predicted GIY-YIG superfamily endonuclease
LAERVEEHVSTEHANWFNETPCVRLVVASFFHGG